MILYDYVKYNVWANRRIDNMVSALTDEEFYKEIISSFPSVHTTIEHILGAETVWYNRLQGISLTAFPDFPNERTALLNLFIQQSEKLYKSVFSLTEEELKTAQTFKDTKGSPYQQTGEEMIQHCVNHSTYHRGQLMMMFRQLEVQNILGLDYITYLRLKTG